MSTQKQVIPSYSNRWIPLLLAGGVVLAAILLLLPHPSRSASHQAAQTPAPDRAQAPVRTETPLPASAPEEGAVPETEPAPEGDVAADELAAPESQEDAAAGEPAAPGPDAASQPAGAPGSTPAQTPGGAQASGATAVVPWGDKPVYRVDSPGQEGALNVVGVVPLPGELFTGRFTVFFDAPIQLPEDQKDNVVRFYPELDGRREIGLNYMSLTLDFAAQRRAGCAVVFAELNPNLKSAAGLPLNPNHSRFIFPVTSMAPSKLWTIEDTAERVVLGVQFPLPVKPETLREHLTITGGNGSEVPFQIEASPDPLTTRIVFAGAPPWPLQATFTKGMPDSMGVQTTTETHTRRYPDETLTVRRAQWGNFQPEQQEIVFSFSKRVEPETLGAFVEITDQGSNQVLPIQGVRGTDGLRCVVAVQVPDPLDARLTVKVKEGLTGAEHTQLVEAFTTELRRVLPSSSTSTAEGTRSRPSVRFEYTWWSQQGKDGLVLNCELSVRGDMANLKEHIQVAPELPGMRIEPEWHGFDIYGEWKSQQAYRITVTPGLTYAGAGVLEEAVSTDVKTEDVPPYVGFGFEGEYYFPRRAAMPLPLYSRNVDEATLTIHRMFPSNVAVALRDLSDSDGRMGGFVYSWCQRLDSKKIPVKGEADRLGTSSLDLDTLLPEGRLGVFCVEASGPDVPGAAKLVVKTDIGALAHWQNDQLVLFAHNLFSLEPLRLAHITVHSTKNQILGTGNTNNQGIVRLGPFDTSLGYPSVAVIEYGSGDSADFTFLKLDAREEDERAFTNEMPSYNRNGYDAFVYADRDIYRPGETAHVRWLVRTNYGDAVAEVPFLLKVLKPNGRELLSQPVTVSAVGSGGTDLVTQRSYPTGKYTAQITVPGEKTVIGSYTFSVEDFVPNRIKSTVTLPEQRWVAGAEYPIHVKAEHLMGAPASDRKCEAYVILKRGVEPFEQWKAFRFENDSDYVPDGVSCGEQQTNAEGLAAFTFKYAAPAQVTFPMKAIALGRVFELGGRPVAGTAETLMFPSDLCLGISARSGAGEAVEVSVAAVKPDGSPSDTPTVKVTLEKQIWSYYVRRYYGYHEPKWSEMFEPVETKEVPIEAGQGNTSFSISGYGYYRLRVHSDTTPQYSTVTFYNYWGHCQLVSGARPSLIKVTLDKPEYTIGEEAEVRIESPFDGQGIVVVQGDGIQQAVPVTIKDNVGTTKFRVEHWQFPNVWVEATVVHALEEGKTKVYPFSSFAMANLRVHDPKRSLAVAFPSMPGEIRPATDVTVDITVADTQGNPVQAELTLAAVDEGIHTITGYENPDPYAWLRRSRRPDFRRAHYYDKVAYDFDKPEPGGDLDALLGKRAAAADENWIKPVALWSGVVQTDESGKAAVTLNVPEFTGQLRFVAVAASNTALGAASANMYVRRPYMLRTSVPRFLLPGDTFQGRAVLFNHTDTACSAEVQWSVGGTIRDGQGSRTIDVPAHGEATLTADFATGIAIGQGEVRWTAVFRDAAGAELERLAETLPLPVRTPAAYQSAHDLIALQPGESRTITNTRCLDDERAELEIVVGANPQLRFLEALKYVVHYPYGCVEQTTSSLFPMYLLRKAKTFSSITFRNEGDLDYFLRAGIDRLFAMQTSSGGLSTWPGGDQPYSYGSVYALHFLTLAKNDKEFTVPEAAFKALQDYVRRLAADWSYEPSPWISYERAYAIFVLALDGDLRAIEQIGRFDDLMLPTASRALLAAALAQNTGDAEAALRYLRERPSQPYTDRLWGKTLNSEIRNVAVELLALSKIGADPARCKEVADKLFAFLKDHRYGNTQETAFIVTALATYLGDISTAVESASASVTGSAEGAIRGEEVFRAKHEGPGGTFTVANTGQTLIFVDLTTRGVPEQSNLNPVAKGMRIAREIRTSQGGAPDTPFRQASSYVVTLRIDCDHECENIVVADLVPAGFEIENPRLVADAVPGAKLGESVTSSYLEVRDDRLVLAFDTLPMGQSLFHYVVRAVTPGTYQYPPVEAECMYDAEVRAVSALSSIEVAP